MVDANMKGAFGGVVVGVVMLLVAFNVSSTTVDASAFGMFDDLSTQEASAVNTTYDEQGDLLLVDGELSGTWTSVRHAVDNQTQLSVHAQELNSNNTLDVTVTGYDAESGGTTTGSKTVTLTSDGKTDVDLSTGIGAQSAVESVEIKYDLSRTATTDVSPEVTGYEGFEEGSTPYLKYLVAIFAIAVMLFSLRGL